MLFLFVLCLCGLASLASAQQLVVSWEDRSTNETGFTIEKRPTVGGVFKEVADVPANREVWVDTAVDTGISYTYRLCAYNAAGFSGYSNTASGIPVMGGAVVARINFQPTASSVPGGYDADDGSLYTAARGYGWDRSLVHTARERQVQLDQRLDTFVATGHDGLGTVATWQMAVPPAAYLVSLASGDAALPQGPHLVLVEGQTTIKRRRTRANQFRVRTDLSVIVLDGLLTVRIGGTEANTMLCYLIVKKQ